MADQPNIRDVAKAAGVSTATVSRALAQPDKVREATLKKVMEAVEATGFVPNRQASMFRQRKSKTVILLVRDISNPFYLDIFKGVEEEAFAAGYKVLMGDAREDDERITHYIDAVRECQADGLILMIGSFPQKLLEQPEKLPPLIVALEEIEGLKAPTVRVDNVGAAEEAVTHLIHQGHKRIVHLTGPLKEYLGQARLEGYRKALQKAGLPIDEELILPGDFSLNAGHDQMANILAQGKEFSGVFAASDQMAIGAASALREQGYSVPDDISLVGFDDTLVASVFYPPLTTVHQPRREIGRAAMALMIRQLNQAGSLEGKAVTVQQDQQFATQLISRQSVSQFNAERPGTKQGV
ncbi:LacI family DNA-binding transcriptional regulator [uncultured Cohaesibacter sp.]|uniref:LacI family DNA-binding transcriptional regulator n=1 Tax=uncultured Cohaesibacter sp. TaxID=1002546 RepID=UPI0029C72823|nr:LacI family DNA-binding transcriptional regulator [uncultured Cohaesibacter sp.]